MHGSMHGGCTLYYNNVHASSWCNTEAHTPHERTCTDMGVIEVGAGVPYTLTDRCSGSPYSRHRCLHYGGKVRKKETAQISRIWISHFTVLQDCCNVQIRPFWWSQRLPRRVYVLEPTHNHIHRSMSEASSSPCKKGADMPGMGGGGGAREPILGGLGGQRGLKRHRRPL
jgi:hypothetical protein